MKTGLGILVLAMPVMIAVAFLTSAETLVEGTYRTTLAILGLGLLLAVIGGAVCVFLDPLRALIFVLLLAVHLPDTLVLKPLTPQQKRRYGRPLELTRAGCLVMLFAALLLLEAVLVGGTFLSMNPA